MARFKFSINVEPKDIPFLDDAHKRDCADSLNNSVDSTLKYTLIMTGAIMALFAAYAFFGFIWMLRMHYMLPDVSGLIPVGAVVIFLFEFISGTMKKWALVLQIIFHLILIFASLTSGPSLVVLPFAAYGAILHFKLITLLPWHKVISEQPGYPEFTPLPEKKKSPSSDKKDGDSENGGSEVHKDSINPEDASADTEKQPDVKISGDKEKTGDTAKADSTGAGEAENKPETAEKQPEGKKPSGGGGKKKHKRRKGQK